jgi:hypothetical protein
MATVLVQWASSPHEIVSSSSLPQLPLSVEGKDSLRSVALLLASSAVMFPRALSIPSIHRLLGLPFEIV